MASGEEETQTSLLLQKCQDFVSFCKESKKRPLEDTKQIPKEKKIKIEIPDEVWLKIIGFMDTQDVFCRFALVCKRFKSLTSDPTAIKRLLINHRNVQKRDSPKFRMLLNKNRTMVEFTLVKACLTTATFVISVALKSNPKLKSLKILNHTNCDCMHEMKELVKCIKKFRPDLEHLELNYVEYNSDAITELCTLKNLKSLKISNGKKQVPDFIYSLANNCIKLENIALRSILPHDFDTAMAWNHFLGKRRTTLKSIYINLNINSGTLGSYYENLHFCKNIEELSIRFDIEHFTVIPDLPNLKKLVLFNHAEPFIGCFQSINLTNLKYLSFRNIFNIDKASFWTNVAMMHFPVLERLYFHTTQLHNSGDLEQNSLQTLLLTNAPKLKSIQFSGNIANDLKEMFLFDMFKNSNLLVIFGNSMKQLEMENYFKNRSTVLYEKYQSKKLEFAKWCENEIIF